MQVLSKKILEFREKEKRKKERKKETPKYYAIE